MKIWRECYNNLPISTVESFELMVDRKIVDENVVTFRVDNKHFKLSQLPELYTKYWYFLDKTEMLINLPASIAKVKRKIDLKFKLKKSNSSIWALDNNIFGVF